jgi:HK97 family phage prohead protease
MTATAGMQAAAQERLDAVLAAPPTGKSRHAQVADLARQHAREHPTRIKAVAAVAATAADYTGEFEALVSDFRPDRQGERFAPAAFDGAIAKIRKAGRSVPVLFGHTISDANSVLGAVPADGWRIDSEGLHARGWVDVNDAVGMKVHKMLKNGALLWSIGFSLVGGGKTGRRGPDGIAVLDQVDELLELSVVPVPANPRTRTVGVKSDRIPTRAELLERETALGLDGALARLEHGRRVIAPSLDELHAQEDALRSDGVIAAVEAMRYRRRPDLDTAVARMREQTREEMTRLLGGKAHRPRRPRDDLRDRPDQASRDYALERALTFDPRA